MKKTRQRNNTSDLRVIAVRKDYDSQYWTCSKVEQVSAALYPCAQRMLKKFSILNQHDVEDMIQNVWTIVLRMDVTSVRDMAAYASQMLKHQIIDFVRSEKKRQAKRRHFAKIALGSTGGDKHAAS